MGKIKNRPKKILSILSVIFAVLLFIGSAGVLHSWFKDSSENNFDATSSNTHQTIEVPDNPQPDEPELIIDSVFANNSWETIASVFKAGKASEYWQLGDTKPIELSDGYTYHVQIVDMTIGRYAYTDGSGRSNGVLQFVECLSTPHIFNNDNNNIGGWAESDCKNWINTAVFAELPEDLQSVISEVYIYSGVGNGTSSGISTSENKLFVPAEFEIIGGRRSSIGSSEGAPQFGYWAKHNTPTERIKVRIDTSEVVAWALRSPYAGYLSYFCIVDGGGNLTDGVASTAHSICPCFAL